MRTKVFETLNSDRFEIGACYDYLITDVTNTIFNKTKFQSTKAQAPLPHVKHWPGGAVHFPVVRPERAQNFF